MAETKILALRSQGKHIKEIACEFDVSTATLSRRIAELKHNQGVLTKYRELQGLQLTDLQFKVLESISPEKIKKASFLELAKCFDILHKAEKRITGDGSSKVNGLLDYLLCIDQEEKERQEH
jgi:transcriptional antiterminator